MRVLFAQNNDYLIILLQKKSLTLRIGPLIYLQELIAFTHRENGPVVMEKKIFRFRHCNFAILVLPPFRSKCVPSYEQI